MSQAQDPTDLIVQHDWESSDPNAQVLLVDDEPIIHATVGMYFKSRGIPLLHATSGADALRLLNTASAVSVVLIDLIMPGMSGLELLRHIKVRHPKVRAFVLTGSATEEVAEKTRELGAEACIEKPYDVDELVTRVASLLPTITAATR